MAAVSTERLLQIALTLAGWTESRAGCAVVSSGTRVSHVLLGVEVGTADLFMARQLGYHAAVAHDPTGTSAALDRDWPREREHLTVNGVPEDTASALIEALAARDVFDTLAADYDHAASVARLLDMPFVVVGTALDEVARRKVQGMVDELAVRKPHPSVADLSDTLLALPEYAAARTAMAPALGEWSAPIGRTLVLGDAYAPSSADIARAYLTHGVDTLCLPAVAHIDTAKWAELGVRGNVLVLGRIATASIGLNAYAARLRSEGLEVTTFTGVVGG